MKKGLKVLVCFLALSFLTNSILAEEGTSKIYILSHSKNKSYSKEIFKVYIDRKFVVSSGTFEKVELCLISKGRINLTIQSAYWTEELNLDISEGTEYFIENVLPNARFRLVDSTKWTKSAVFVNSTIVLKEDETNPWGKIDNTKKSGKGQGTCFAISSNGYLVTNYHCIENAKEITVKGIDGDLTTKYGATVVASDPSNDLALIKVSNKNVKFNVPDFGVRSSGVAQAEKVYALGFPAAAAMGAEVKITEGIISAKSGVGGDISKFQISAAVNPGNSGGPLIDEQGNLVGVIFAKSTIAESAGYAIKASYLETFLKNVDGFEFPTFTNTMKDKSLTDKVADWKNFIFIVETN